MPTKARPHRRTDYTPPGEAIPFPKRTGNDDANWLAEYLRAGFSSTQAGFTNLHLAIDGLTTRVDELEATVAPLAAKAQEADQHRDHVGAALAHAIIVLPTATVLALVGGILASHIH